MKPRAFDVILLPVVFIGGLLTWQAARERSRLSERYARLARITGDHPIADPSKVHLQALDTDEPMHFAWRVYLPPNYTTVVTGRCFSEEVSSRSWVGPSPGTGPSDFIGRVRFRVEPQEGAMQVSTRFGRGESVRGIAHKALAERLRAGWDRVRVEQLGAPGLAVLEPNQPAVLLRLTLPDDLQEEARKWGDFGSVLFELAFDPKATIP
jgi:hypothetical protein